MSTNRGLLVRTLSSNRKRKRRRKRRKNNNNNNNMNAARKPPFHHGKEEEDEDDNTKPSRNPPSPDPYEEDEVESSLVDYVIGLSKLSYRSDYKQKGVMVSNPLKPIPRSKPESTYELGGSSTKFVSCTVCKEAKPIGAEDMVHVKRCGHIYCLGCIPDLVAGQINDLKDITRVKCAESKCKNVFSYEDFNSLVPEEVMQRWKAAKDESSVLWQPIRWRCPFEECWKVFVDDERGFQIRACPYCWRVFCVHCRVKWHLGKSCMEFQEEKRREEMELVRKREEDAVLLVQLIQRFDTVNEEIELLQKQAELLNEIRNHNSRGIFHRRRSMWDNDWDVETQRAERMEQLEQEKAKILKQLADLGLPLRAVLTVNDMNEEE